MRKLLFSEYLTCDTAQVCLSILYYHNVPNPWNNNNDDNVCYLLAEMASAWLYCYYCCCCCRCRDGDLSATRSVGQTSHAVVVKMILCLWPYASFVVSRGGRDVIEIDAKSETEKKNIAVEGIIIIVVSYCRQSRVLCECLYTNIHIIVGEPIYLPGIQVSAAADRRHVPRRCLPTWVGLCAYVHLCIILKCILLSVWRTLNNIIMTRVDVIIQYYTAVADGLSVYIRSNAVFDVNAVYIMHYTYYINYCACVCVFEKVMRKRCLYRHHGPSTLAHSPTQSIRQKEEEQYTDDRRVYYTCASLIIGRVLL